tara:strand:+ start:933 stop:1784 length:852 start_codon:yes stop_codon:yes gene_type:complete
MKNKKQHFLYPVKDHLVSGEVFNIYWDKQNKRAWTDLGNVKDVSLYYQSDQYISHQNESKSLTQRLYSLGRIFMLRYKYRLLKPYVKSPSKLLDIGCGAGVFLSFMNNKNFDVFGVENNERANEICAKKKLKVYESINQLATKDFDLVTLWHVLEHLPSPEDAITKIHSLLSDEGILVVAVPNFDSHDRKHYQNDWAAFDVPRHLWHFTPQGLEEMLSDKGFKLLKKTPLWLDVFYISFLSEKQKGKPLAFFSGIIKGFYFTILSLCSNKHSTISFVFKKSVV